VRLPAARNFAAKEFAVQVCNLQRYYRHQRKIAAAAAVLLLLLLLLLAVDADTALLYSWLYGTDY